MVPRHFRGWVDTSCNIRVACLCQLGGEASPAFLAAAPTLETTNKPEYGRCGRGRECFWVGGDHALMFRTIFLALGAPCFAVLLWTCGLHKIGGFLRRKQRGWEQPQARSVAGAAGGGNSSTGTTSSFPGGSYGISH